MTIDYDSNAPICRNYFVIVACLVGKVGLDLGCGVGRASFELAKRFGHLVLGVDINFPMIQMGQNVIQHNRVMYPKKRNGIIYDHVEFPIKSLKTEKVDFWVCDGLALPFRKEYFGLILAMNALDCVQHLLTS